MPAATALIRPLAWETPYAAGADPETTKNKNEVTILHVSGSLSEEEHKDILLYISPLEE